MQRSHFVFDLRLGFLCCLAVAFLAGCAPRTPRVDNFFGTSYALAKQSQVADAKAGVNNPPPTGMEGRIGEKVMERYATGFVEKAPKSTTYTLSVGGVTTSH